MKMSKVIVSILVMNNGKLWDMSYEKKTIGKLIDSSQIDPLIISDFPPENSST